MRTVEELLRGKGSAIPSAALLTGVAQAGRVSPHRAGRNRWKGGGRDRSPTALYFCAAFWNFS